jgi:hypothetical protein
VDFTDLERNCVFRVENEGLETQLWVSPNRYVVIDLATSPLHYGKIETEEKGANIASLYIDRSRELWQVNKSPLQTVKRTYTIISFQS